MPRGRAGARPERVLVVADPDPDGWPRRPPNPPSVPASQGGRHPFEIVGQRHLEVGRVAGDGMDRDSTGLKQGGLVRSTCSARRAENAA